jgi:hypothetical protein
MTQITPTVTISIYISAAWVDISADWINNGQGDCYGSWGMPDNRHTTRVAHTGELVFILNNSTCKYSPGHASAMAGFGKGARVRMDIVSDGTTKRLHGTIANIDPDFGTTRSRKTKVTVLDWMEYASNYPLVNPTVQANKRGDEVVTSTVALMPIAPLATSYNTGVNTFTTVFDINARNARAYNEFAKVSLSEMGYIYLKKDATYGETLVFEGAHYRNGLRALKTFTASGGTVTASFSNNMLDLDAPYGENVINYMTATAEPRRVSDAEEVLFQTDTWVMINPGQTVELKGYYTNPNGGGSVYGQDMVDPVATTDYLMNTAADGSGGNITADLVVVTGYGSDGFTHQLTNNNASVGFVRPFQCRGYAVYADTPLESIAQSSASIDDYGYHTDYITMRYQQTIDYGKAEAEKIVDEEKEPRTKLNSVSFCANVSTTMMQAFLNIDIGDLIEITESHTGVDGWYYVQGVQFDILPGRVIMFTWILKQTYNLTSGLSLVSCEFSDAGTDSLDVGLIPHIDNLAQRSDSFWIYAKAFPSEGDAYANIFGTGMFNITVNPIGHVFILVWRSVSPGQWRSADQLSIGQWVHCVITIDNSSVANDPIIYIDGGSLGVAEIIAPSGTLSSQYGYLKYFGKADYVNTGLVGIIKDYRIYNRILSAGEVSTLFSEGAGGTGVSSTGLLFQGPCVRTRDLTYYTGHTMTADDRLIDNIYGVTGSASGTPVTAPINYYVLTPASLDTYISSSSPTANVGTYIDLFIGRSGASFRRSLIKFDLTSISQPEICTSAILSVIILGDNATVPVVWDLYRVLRNWSTEACWNTYSPGNNWATAGGMGAGDVDGTIVGSSMSIPADTAGNTEIQIVLDPAIIQGLWDGTYNNYGLLVKSRDESASGDLWSLYSSDHATVAYRPKLTILTQAP